jgi:hypothetical protein
MANKGLFGVYCSESRANSSSNYKTALDKDLYLSLSEMGKVVSIANSNSYKIFLPDARQISYTNSMITIVNKHATNYIEVRSNGNYLIKIIPPNSSQTITNTSKSTSAGEWSTTNNTTPLTQIALVSETTGITGTIGDPAIVMLTDTLGIMTYVSGSNVNGKMFNVSRSGVVTFGTAFNIAAVTSPAYIQNVCKLTNSSIIIVTRLNSSTNLNVSYLWGLTSLASTATYNYSLTIGIGLHDGVEIRVYTVSPTIVIVVCELTSLTAIYFSSFKIVPDTSMTYVTSISKGAIEGRIAVLSTTRAILIYKDNPRKNHAAFLISIAADGTIAFIGSAVTYATMTVDRAGADIVALSSSVAVGLDIFSSDNINTRYTWVKFTVTADVLSVSKVNDLITTTTGEYFRMATLSNGKVLLVRSANTTAPSTYTAELITYQTDGTYVTRTTAVTIRASDVNNQYNFPSIALIDNSRIAVSYQCTPSDANISN